MFRRIFFLIDSRKGGEVFQVNGRREGDRWEGRIEGEINEKFDLSVLRDPGIRQITLSCRRISNINSNGIRLWIALFEDLERRGVRLRFLEFPVALVGPLNVLLNFVPATAEVESVEVPFYCPKCRRAVQEFLPVAELSSEAPKRMCPYCLTEWMIFDEVPEEYLGFVNRRGEK